MVDAILELIAVEAYLIGTLTGIILYNRMLRSHRTKQAIKYSCPLGIFLIYLGMLLRAYPVMYAGCFLTCIILGPLFVSILGEVRGFFR